MNEKGWLDAPPAAGILRAQAWIVPGRRRRYKYSNCAVFSREPKVYKASSRLTSLCRKGEDQISSNPRAFGASSSTGGKVSCYRVPLEARFMMGQHGSMLYRIRHESSPWYSLSQGMISPEIDNASYTADKADRRFATR